MILSGKMGLRSEPVFINGKFYSAGLNGVHRVADRLIRELDREFAREGKDAPETTLFVPSKRSLTPTLHHIRIVEEKRGDTQFWEQTILPFRARGGLLLNFCNLAPIAHRRKVLMVHDAQFLLKNSGYALRQIIGYRLLLPWMARSSLKTITVSEFSKQMLDILGVSEPGRTVVLYNGANHILDEAARDVRNDLPGGERPYVIHFASSKAYKNTAVLLTAFRLPQLAGIDLVLIGASKGELASFNLAGDPNIKYLGKINDAHLRALYERALCLAMPSRTEGFGLPPIEAMNCGCPVIVAPSGAMPEICRDAVLYADVDDPSSWAEAIYSYLNNETVRNQKIEAGRQRAAAFTWELAGHHLRGLIRSLQQDNWPAHAPPRSASAK